MTIDDELIDFADLLTIGNELEMTEEQVMHNQFIAATIKMFYHGLVRISNQAEFKGNFEDMELVVVELEKYNYFYRVRIDFVSKKSLFYKPRFRELRDLKGVEFSFTDNDVKRKIGHEIPLLKKAKVGDPIRMRVEYGLENLETKAVERWVNIQNSNIVYLPKIDKDKLTDYKAYTELADEILKGAKDNG